MPIDRPFLFASLREHLFISFTTSQVAGINHILDVWEAKYSAHPLSYLAYAMATAYHETGKAMAPVPEGGRGAGHSYGIPTGPWHQVYYGRGDVQITWEANYKHASVELAKIGINVDLDPHPELALDPTIAAHIMFCGMIEGWFTGKKLADYIPSDPVNARRIINGTDRAQTVASYYTAFNASLRLSAPPVPAPVAATTPTVVAAVQPPVQAPGFWSRIHTMLSRKS